MLLRMFALFTLLATSGSGVFAQRYVTHAHDTFTLANHEGSFDVRFGGIPDEIIQKVRSALNLTDVQVNALKTLVAMREQSIEQIGRSMEEAQTKLEELVSQTSPNATDVGNAVLATRAIDDKIKAAAEKFRNDLRGMLTADQRSTLEKLKSASEQVRALEEAGILDNAFEHVGPFSMQVFEPAFAFGIHRGVSKQD